MAERKHKWVDIVPGITPRSTLQICTHCGTFRSMESGKYYRGFITYNWKHSRIVFDSKSGFNLEFTEQPVKCHQCPVPIDLPNAKGENKEAEKLQ